MQIANYVAAVGRRWLWVVAAAMTAAVLAVGSALLAPDTWRSTAVVYVGASSTVGPEGTAYAALVPKDVLPSLLGLARSPAVLGPVVDRLALGTTPHRLADTIEAAIQDNSSILSISATAATPREAALIAEAVTAELAGRTGELFGSEVAPLLTLTTVRPATAPRWSTGLDVRRGGVLGLGGGAALAIVVCGLLERARPRVRSESDVAALTDAPVLAALPGPGSGRDTDARAAELERLRWTLEQVWRSSADTLGGRLLVAGGSRVTEALAAELSAAAPGGRQVTAVAGAGAGAGSLADAKPAAGDAVLLVIDGRRATAREVRTELDRLAHTPVVLTGVVVDGVPPRRPRLRERLMAALCGRAPVPAVLERRRAALGAVSGTGVAALLGLFLVGLHRPLPLGATTGLVAVVALLPLWIGVLRQSRTFAWLAALAGVGVLSGLLLSRAALSDHDFARYEAAATGFLVITMIGAVGVLLWARTMLPLPVAVLALAAGYLVDAILRSPGSVNAFKYELTIPITAVVLALLAIRRRPVALVATVAVLATLALANLTFDARSAAGFCVLAAVLVGWQARPAPAQRGAWWGRTALALGLGAVGAYAAFSELLLSGLAGTELQQRTATQIEQSGSLLLGGRPEWTATWALMRAQPFGFGLGTVPSVSDVTVAKEGMSIAHIPTAEGYIENYMFAGRFELHSIVADLWSNLGLVGLLLGLVIAGLLVQRLSVLLQRRQASALACFVTLNALWALAFAPLPTEVLVVALALGVLLPTPVRADGERPTAVGSRQAEPATPRG